MTVPPFMIPGVEEKLLEECIYCPVQKNRKRRNQQILKKDTEQASDKIIDKFCFSKDME